MVATGAGLLAGLATGIFHTFMGIPAILAGILTQLSLYSINLKIMGKANQAINVDKFNLLVSLRRVKGVALTQNTLFIVAIMIIILIANLGGGFVIVEQILIYASLILTVISLITYLWQNRSVLSMQE